TTNVIKALHHSHGFNTNAQSFIAFIWQKHTSPGEFHARPRSRPYPHDHSRSARTTFVPGHSDRSPARAQLRSGTRFRCQRGILLPLRPFGMPYTGTFLHCYMPLPANCPFSQLIIIGSRSGFLANIGTPCSVPE